jgi:hypothetical protein
VKRLADAPCGACLTQHEAFVITAGDVRSRRGDLRAPLAVPGCRGQTAAEDLDRETPEDRLPRQAEAVECHEHREHPGAEG